MQLSEYKVDNQTNKDLNKINEQVVPEEIRESIADVQLPPSLLEKVQNEEPKRESLLTKGEENNE